jgi:hypothetical protein
MYVHPGRYVYGGDLGYLVQKEYLAGFIIIGILSIPPLYALFNRYKIV